MPRRSPARGEKAEMTWARVRTTPERCGSYCRFDVRPTKRSCPSGRVESTSKVGAPVNEAPPHHRAERELRSVWPTYSWDTP